MKHYPALDVQSANPDLLYPLIDDFAPTAVEERDDGLRAFFASPGARDAALAALDGRFSASAVDVADDDWARRSQQNLTPVTVGRITVCPDPRLAVPHQLSIVVVPSMGFGTGHHATTRLCLSALQEIGLSGKTVLDVGTGSGVLALAADRLGAASALGIDNDADAIQSAGENLALNPEAAHVRFALGDLSAEALPEADIVVANLTGALLVKSARRLLAAIPSGGTLVLSGLMSHERDDVRAAFPDASVAWEREEDGWIGLSVKKP